MRTAAVVQQMFRSRP